MYTLHARMGRRCATWLLLCAAVLLACCLCGCAANDKENECGSGKKPVPRLPLRLYVILTWEYMKHLLF
ncbi:hypothetical protein ABB37_09468 [Leptomonas pyrrhocoris]|uniref:Uncharacterized protein n=1 Tax=Leptomonas pyrrhocoris TaxID=157538 RepID=A0A0N1J477_LEPPY|nr:hypothetical protein ABB37_09468 [Leptomonas pyrrhocoris]KPA73824.1 hypothetical protein ABB37_09468 [Leptomonas pyrrhocoris]|eukprot:XP_015652263.1 hypothetical protein ABB37_09468 [Leptomonas pyrrhocoris]